MKRLFMILLGLAIIAGGVGTAVLLVRTKPKAERKRPPRMTPVVNVVDIQRADHDTEVSALGTVIPAKTVGLKPRVGGEVVHVHDNWMEGGQVAAGEVLVGLDPSDYQISVSEAEAALAQAESNLALEQGRQAIAREEWKLLGTGDEAGPADHELALRVPQLKAAQAQVDAARARLRRARLDLERCSIRSPMNAVILERHAELGDQVAARGTLVTLVGIDAYHVRVSVPVDELAWIHVAEDGRGVAATVHLTDGATRDGRALHRLPDLEPQGRMARLLVEVPSPLEGEHPLFLGSFLRVTIEGRRIEDAYKIPGSAFRDGREVWVLSAEDRLKIVPVVPLWQSRSHVFFRADLAEGDRLIVSDLGVSVDGMELRVTGGPEG